MRDRSAAGALALRRAVTSKTGRLVAAVFLLSALAGCGDDNDGPPPPPANTPTPAATATAAASATATATALPSTPTPLPPTETAIPATPTPVGPVAVRAVPYEVRDTAQAHQLTIYNARPGGGSVGMPVRIGDVDGDGHADFIASPMLADSGPNGDRHNSGEVHIYFGNGEISGVVVNTPDATNITTIMGARAGDLLGNEPHVIDIDGDGLADLLIGAQNYDGFDGDRHNCGGVFLYYGRPGNPRYVDLAEDQERVVEISGAEAGDRLGVWVTSGDLDGDGQRDILLGADQADGPNDERPDAGAIYVIFGGQPLPARIDLANPGTLRMAEIDGIDPGDHLGSTILAVDADGDGRDDILCAGGLARGSSQIEGTFLAGGDGPDNQRSNAGDVYLLFSPASFPALVDLAIAPAADRVTMYGANKSDVAGEELAAGDLDGDGKVDLAIGSLQASGPGGPTSSRGPATGRTYLVFDAASRRGNTIDFADPGPGVTTIYGRRKGGISGDTLIIQDMDGDGYADLWDASPSLGTRDLAGTFRPASGLLDVIFGRPSWPSSIDLLLPPDDLRLVQIHGPDANDQFSYGMAVGDADADGRPDLIINAMAGDGVDNMELDAGELYVLGNQVLFDTSASARAPLYLNVDIQPIFEAACLPCHQGDNAEGDLRLDIIQNSMVDLLGEDGQGRTSTEVSDLIVAPGDPEASYLIEKLESTADNPARVGDPMPQPPATPLPGRVIADVRRWIEEGAPIANEDLPPPPPPPSTPAEGFATTFFARMRMVLSDPSLGEIESVLLDPPAAFPFRLMGPRLTVPAADFEKVTIPSDFGKVVVELRQDGAGVIDRQTGDITLSITLVQIALDGAVENTVPVMLTTGAQSDGPFSTEGKPLDFVGGTLKLAGVGRIPADTPIVGGDPVLVELDGSVAPSVPMVPGLTDEIQPIFNQSCALANCHVGDGAGGLNLEQGRAYQDLVNVPSTQVGGVRVAPGDVNASYLVEKVTADPPRVGERMPIGNALDDLDVEAIEQWIAGGAPQ